MKKLLVAVALVVTIASHALAQSGLITMASKYSVPETIQRLEAAVKGESGFQVFALIDYQAIAAAQGRKVRPSQLLLFGRAPYNPCFRLLLH